MQPCGRWLPLLGLCFDTGHYRFGGGDPLAGLQRHADRIWHVHFKDHDPRVATTSREEEWDAIQSVGHGLFCELRKGYIDFPAILAQLCGLNYTGWIVVEQNVLPGMGSPKASAARNRQYLAGIELQRRTSMNSRERVSLALNHQEADRLPLDLGGSNVTGMNVSVVYKLRQALGLDAPGTPVKVVEPYQMLGEIAPDLLDALGVDVVPLRAPRTMFGFPNEGWKPWTIFDGTPVLVPEGFNIDPEPNGDLLMYPEGDKSALPSGRMPKDGFYFDAVIRQHPVDDEKLNVADNLEEFTPVTEEDLAYYRTESERLYATDRAVFADFGSTSFGDVAAVPGIQMRQHPKGIRDIQEWYMSTAMRQDYVYQVFEGQCEMGLANLRRVYEAVGERVTLCFVTGADFGMQGGPLISPRTYRKLFQPFHKRINEWIHTNTGWKTFIHSCGSVVNLIEDFIASGFDIVNPVQTSAAGMDPRELKRRFGDRVTFWGGGVDTQKELPYGTPDEVQAQVRERIETFGPGGGFVFNTVHNVQPKTPIENVLAMYETVAEYGRYVQRDPVAR